MDHTDRLAYAGRIHAIVKEWRDAEIVAVSGMLFGGNGEASRVLSWLRKVTEATEAASAATLDKLVD